MLLNRPTNQIIHRPGLSINISSNKRIADKPGMYNANNKPMESRQLKSRKTDSNDWIGNMINKHLTQKGASWPLYAAVSAYAMNTFTSTALQGLSPFELVFARKP